MDMRGHGSNARATLRRKSCRAWVFEKLERVMGIDAALIERERSRLPERTFKQEYGGEFVEGSGAVFRHVRDCATGALQEPHEDRRYFAGLDLAKVEDYTVLTILDDKLNVVFVDRFHRLDWSIQTQRIKTDLQRYRNPEVYVDSTGAGEPIIESLRRENIRAKPEALPVHAAEQGRADHQPLTDVRSEADRDPQAGAVARGHRRAGGVRVLGH
jgi:hypothetical protein